MRVRRTITSAVLAVGLAGAAAVGAPAAQAAQTGEARTESAASGFLTCGESGPLEPDPYSSALACLSSYNGNVTAVAQVDFNSQVPTAWTTCVAYAYLDKIGPGGTVTIVSSGVMVDCKADAAASGLTTVVTSAPVEVGSTYRARVVMGAAYLGLGWIGAPAVSPTVTVL